MEPAVDGELYTAQLPLTAWTAGAGAGVVGSEVFDAPLQSDEAGMQVLDVLLGGGALPLQLIQPHVTQSFDVLHRCVGGEQEAVMLLLFDDRLMDPSLGGELVR